MNQKDINGQSGLSKAINLINAGLVDASVITFTMDDIVRGGVCKQWVQAW